MLYCTMFSQFHLCHASTFQAQSVQIFLIIQETVFAPILDKETEAQGHAVREAKIQTWVVQMSNSIPQRKPGPFLGAPQ